LKARRCIGAIRRREIYRAFIVAALSRDQPLSAAHPTNGEAFDDALVNPA
jgi:hypothetical protein